METRSRNAYEAPVSVVMEMKMERMVCQSDPNQNEAQLIDYGDAVEVNIFDYL